RAVLRCELYRGLCRAGIPAAAARSAHRDPRPGRDRTRDGLAAAGDPPGSGGDARSPRVPHRPRRAAGGSAVSEARELPRRVVVAGDGQLGVLAAIALKRSLPACDVLVIGAPPDPAAMADRMPTALPF